MIDTVARVLMTENACAKDNYNRCKVHTGSRWDLANDVCRDAQGDAELALEAALPLIEVQVREQLAYEILAIPNNYPAGPRNFYDRALKDAAEVARGRVEA